MTHQGPPTLAARLTELSDRWKRKSEEAYASSREAQFEIRAVKLMREAEVYAACATDIRALVAALPPEPVTPIGGGSQGHELNRCGGCGGRGSEPLRDGLCETCWPKYPALRRRLCQECGGNGTLRIPNGVRVCPRCDGECWEDWTLAEPVTPPPSVPVLHIPPDIAKGSAVATPPTPAPKQEPTVRLSKTFDITSEKLPTLTGPPLSLTATLRESFSAPADDARGLAVDMLDFDRLDRYADGVVDASAVAWLEDFRVRLQRNIGEVLSLREDYRKQRKEILTLQAEHEYERDAANELREIVEELRAERDALRTVMEQIYRYALNAQGDLRFDVIARQAYDALRLTEAR